MKRSQWLGMLTCGVLMASSAHADLIFVGNMTGANENPANPSTATGFTRVVINDGLTLMSVHLEWAGITGGAPRDAHIHCCTNAGTNVGVAVGFAPFPTTLSGTFDRVFDLLNPTIYTAGFLGSFGGAGTAAGGRVVDVVGARGSGRTAAAPARGPCRLTRAVNLRGRRSGPALALARRRRQ